MKNKVVKGILLMLGVVFAAMQTGDVIWPAVIISAVAVGGGYFVKNIFFQSVSEDGVFDWRDVASALLLAVFATLGESINSFVIDNHLDWLLLIKTIGTVVMTYFSTTFFEKPKEALPTT